LTLFLFAISLGFRGQGVTASVRRSVYRDVASNFARSATAEALHILRKESNQEGTLSFRLMHTQGPATMTLGLDQLPHTFGELAVEKRYGLEGGVEIRILRRAASSLLPEERVPFEALGVLRVTASVKGPRRMVGKSEADYGYRVVLTAAPRPFDLPTFMLVNPTELLRRGAYKGDPNIAIETSAAQIKNFHKILQEMESYFGESAKKAEKKLRKSLIPKNIKKKLKKALQILQGLQQSYSQGSKAPTWPARAWIVREPDAATLDNYEELHVFHSQLLVYSLESEIELEKLNLPSRVGSDASEVEREEPKLIDQGKKVEAALNAQNPDQMDETKTLCLDYLKKVLEQVRRLDAMLQVYKEFQDLLIEVGGDAQEELLMRYRRLRFADQEWKTPYLFHGPQAVAQATKFLASHPRGMVVVNTPEGSKEELVVRLNDFQGRLVLVSTAPLRLEQIRLRDATRDAVICIGYNGLEVAGEVEAGLIDRSGQYISGGDTFTGSLILDHLTSDSPLDLIFRGKLRHQDALLSGPDSGSGGRPPPLERNLEVIIGPEPLHRMVEL
jgi:ElaB/YqjD/DUF883 family membrane-anchored ribosome-binding protein